LQSGPERVALCNLGHFFEADEIDDAEPGEAGDRIQCDWTIRAGVLENHDGLWKQRDHFLEELLVLVDQRSIVEVILDVLLQVVTAKKTDPRMMSEDRRAQLASLERFEVGGDQRRERQAEQFRIRRYT